MYEWNYYEASITFFGERDRISLICTKLSPRKLTEYINENSPRDLVSKFSIRTAPNPDNFKGVWDNFVCPELQRKYNSFDEMKSDILIQGLSKI